MKRANLIAPTLTGSTTTLSRHHGPASVLRVKNPSLISSQRTSDGKFITALGIAK